MNAKQDPGLGSLFVRLPVGLKRRLKGSAHAHRSSMSREAVRLLDAQLQSDIPAYLKLQSIEGELSACRSHLRLLEEYILSFTAAGDPVEGGNQLQRLRDDILKRRKERLRQQRESQKRHKEHALQDQANRATAQVFGALLNSKEAASHQGQLDEPERRRVNLLNEISSRGRGTKKRIAEALGWSPSQVSQLLSHPDAKGHRRVSDAIARQIESELRLAKGALDRLEQSAFMVDLQRASSALDSLILKPVRQRRR